MPTEHKASQVPNNDTQLPSTNEINEVVLASGRAGPPLHQPLVLSPQPNVGNVDIDERENGDEDITIRPPENIDDVPIPRLSH